MSERGNYNGKPVHQCNPVIGWGAGMVVGEVAASATAWALRPVMPAVDLVERGYRAQAGVRDLMRGSQVMGGFAAPGLTQVGAEWWHGVGDRREALQILADAFRAVATEIGVQLQERALEAAQQPEPELVRRLDLDTQWVAAEVQPLLQRWGEFRTRELESLWTMVATDWGAFERWLDRLRALRQLARARGFVLLSQEPADLPKTVWDRASTGEGGPASWLGVVKIGVAAAVGLAGFYGLYTALRGHR